MAISPGLLAFLGVADCSLLGKKSSTKKRGFTSILAGQHPPGALQQVEQAVALGQGTPGVEDFGFAVPSSGCSTDASNHMRDDIPTLDPINLPPYDSKKLQCFRFGVYGTFGFRGNTL